MATQPALVRVFIPVYPHECVFLGDPHGLLGDEGVFRLFTLYPLHAGSAPVAAGSIGFFWAHIARVTGATARERYREDSSRVRAVVNLAIHFTDGWNEIER